MSDDVELSIDLPVGGADPGSDEDAPSAGAVRDPDCLFCRIVAGEIKNAEVVYQDDVVVAFKDIQPKAPVHVLVVPRHHVRDWSDLAETASHLAEHLFEGVRQAASVSDIDQYRVVANTGSKAGQTVYHLHLHVLGGRPMLWPPG